MFLFLRLTVITLSSVILTLGFTVAPLGLSGTYSSFGNYAKAGKSGYGVSWSKNLDVEIKQRKILCHSVPEYTQYQYRYHNETGTCYKVGERGPCGENMVFFGYQTNAVYGQCDCNYNDNGRALIYHHGGDGDHMCHFVYTRGYCNDNEWLTFNSAWEPICETNKCLGYYLDVNKIIPEYNQILQKSVSVEFVPYSGSCAILGTSCEDKEGNSQWGSLSHVRHEVQFVKGRLEPRCAPVEYIKWRYPTPKLQCLPGGFLQRNKNKCFSHHLFQI